MIMHIPHQSHVQHIVYMVGSGYSACMAVHGGTWLGMDDLSILCLWACMLMYIGLSRYSLNTIIVVRVMRVWRRPRVEQNSRRIFRTFFPLRSQELRGCLEHETEFSL